MSCSHQSRPASAKRSGLLMWVALLVLLGGCGEPEQPASASDQLSTPALAPPPGKPTLNICATEWMPFSYLIAGKPSGVMVELAQDIARDLGYEPHIHFMGLQRCYAEMQQQRMDLSLYTSPLALARRGAQLQPVKPSVQNQLPTLVVNHQNPLADFPGLTSFGGKKIAGIRGNSIMLREHSQGIEWVPVNHLDYLWQLLVSERVDAVLGDYHSQVMLSPEQHQAVRFLLPPIDVEPIYWAVHHNNAALAEQLSKALQQRLAKGSVDTAYRRHMGISHAQLQQMIESNDFQHLHSQSAQR